MRQAFGALYPQHLDNGYLYPLSQSPAVVRGFLPVKLHPLDNALLHQGGNPFQGLLYKDAHCRNLGVQGLPQLAGLL